MRVVSAADVDRLLDPASLADAIDAAFRSDIVVPPRHHHDIERQGDEATLLLMPAWTGASVSPAYLGTKLVTIFRGNAARGLPSVLGSYILQDGATGAPLAAIDGTRLTVWRTAAASAVAGRYLSRPDASRMVMVGAGALSPFLIRAHAAQRPLTDIAVWNHRFERARELADALKAEGLPVRAVDDLEAAVREADIVSCATLSVDPLVRGEWLKPGVHLDCVGAFKPTMRETDDACVRRAALFCDTRAGATKEGGDLAIPLASGLIGPGDVRADLFDLCRGVHRGRRAADEITLFKSVGTAIEDLAGAMLVWDRLNASVG
ncbi:ornithine cyclodeaminase family protein [Alsobacter sp. SYSU M60028]|uniref:Ornithine cyclodeaminase family protein n=1 Tax=Alsobacter ponti TaxID=2962936 RepID=A0ABT1LBK3_9HYPH|nr:ornithine cyclodeaminase family protein [Alsobacter ponti]MCP8938814.1 ornithine cyclodeaminase family protein [Alsobacter ponti]